MLDSPFGKDNSLHSFVGKKCFRHTLVHLLKSDFLDKPSQASLFQASKPAYKLQHLINVHDGVDFSGLRGFPRDMSTFDPFDEDYQKKMTALFLHF